VSDSVVKPYEAGGSKKEQVEQMFDSVAHKYDWLNRLLSMRIDVLWRKIYIKKLKKTNPQYLLDVATGTADVALEMVKQMPSAKVVGLDLSEGMLSFGRKKVEEKGLSKQIELVKGDSEALPFENETFDGVTASFGVRNFENLEKGLEEMLRVTKAGGMVTILEFSQPTAFPFKQLYTFYFKNILPIIGKMTSKDPKAYTYLFESVQTFPFGGEFLEILKRCGYENVTTKPLTLGICSIYTGYKS